MWLGSFTGLSGVTIGTQRPKGSSMRRPRNSPTTYGRLSNATAMRSSFSATSPVGWRVPASQADTAGWVTSSSPARSAWLTPIFRRSSATSTPL